MPDDEVREFADALVKARGTIKYCSVCGNFTDSDPCPICANPNRDKGTICVVEQPKDIMTIEKVKELEILSESDDAGVFIVSTSDYRKVFITGHLEYDRETLKDEYFRDKEKGLEICIPENYFPKDDTTLEPVMSWRGSAHIVFANWLNYCVYQNTPFNINDIRND